MGVRNAPHCTTALSERGPRAGGGGGQLDPPHTHTVGNGRPQATALLGLVLPDHRGHELDGDGVGGAQAVRGRDLRRLRKRAVGGLSAPNATAEPSREDGRGVGAGTCFDFHSGRGGGAPPWTPYPLPWTPSPPPPFFSHGKKNFGVFAACHTLCTYCSVCAPYTLFSRLPCPNARCQCISAFQSHRCHAQNAKT